MSLPFFYIAQYDPSQSEIKLDENTSRHIVSVLRMKINDAIHLTDGKGNLIIADIINDHKKSCNVKITDSRFTPHDSRSVSVAISLLKNPSRFEWFLEKATELGVRKIIPLICARTEKEKFRFDRMQGICISAMLQSQQCWLPELHEPMQFDLAVAGINTGQKFIGYCGELAEKMDLSKFQPVNNPTIFIGPEGDFTDDEITLALKNDFNAVSLGPTRLRTETAGLVASTLLINS